MWDFSSRRSPVYSRHGMVTCTQPLAAECGLSILKAGGNAVDAAVAVAAAMNGALVLPSLLLVLPP
jgi:gamma-glutamyltranspeptidase / glutathione hydrolase